MLTTHVRRHKFSRVELSVLPPRPLWRSCRGFAMESSSDYVWGIHPCAAVLASESRSVLRVIQDSSGAPGHSAAPIFALAAVRGLPMQRVDRNTFARMFGDANAQGVGMIVERANPLAIDDPVAFTAAASKHRLAGSPPVVIALDELTDPQNVGAILRTAQLMGVSAVLVCERNSAPLNGTVSKTSSGALEWVLSSERLLVTRHLASLLGSISEEGGAVGAWRVVGCSVGVPQGQGQQKHPEHISFGALSRSAPTVLVLGNEGRGLRRSVLQSCTHTVSAPMYPHVGPGDFASASSDVSQRRQKLGVRAATPEMIEAVLRLGAIDSYNVSVAAGVLLAKLQLQHD